MGARRTHHVDEAVVELSAGPHPRGDELGLLHFDEGKATLRAIVLLGHRLRRRGVPERQVERALGAFEVPVTEAEREDARRHPHAGDFPAWDHGLSAPAADSDLLRRHVGKRKSNPVAIHDAAAGKDVRCFSTKG